MSPAKTPLVNQHAPLHQQYGPNDCCLCKSEAQIKLLEAERDAALAECERLRGDNTYRMRQEQEERIAQQAAALKTAGEWIKASGFHLYGCTALKVFTGKCDCGHAKIRAEIEALTSHPEQRSAGEAALGSTIEVESTADFPSGINLVTIGDDPTPLPVRLEKHVHQWGARPEGGQWCESCHLPRPTEIDFRRTEER